MRVRALHPIPNAERVGRHLQARRRLWLKAAEPVKECHQHFQSVLLGVLHRVAQSDPFLLHIRVILELDVLPLERDRVVELELKGVLEHLRDRVLAEVQRKGVCDIGHYKGNIVDRCFGEDGRQSGEHVMQTASTSATRDGAISEDENSSDGVHVLLNLSRETLLVELGLLRTASVNQTRRAKDANLEKRLCVLITFRDVGTYH